VLVLFLLFLLCLIINSVSLASTGMLIMKKLSNSFRGGEIEFSDSNLGISDHISGFSWSSLGLSVILTVSESRKIFKTIS